MIKHIFYASYGDSLREGYFLDEENSHFVWYRKINSEPSQFFAGNDVSKIGETIMFRERRKYNQELTVDIDSEEFDELYRDVVRAGHYLSMLTQEQNKVRGKLDEILK
jgi:hypothetical protein